MYNVKGLHLALTPSAVWLWTASKNWKKISVAVPHQPYLPAGRLWQTAISQAVPSPPTQQELEGSSPSWPVPNWDGFSCLTSPSKPDDTYCRCRGRDTDWAYRKGEGWLSPQHRVCILHHNPTADMQYETGWNTSRLNEYMEQNGSETCYPHFRGRTQTLEESGSKDISYMLAYYHTRTEKWSPVQIDDPEPSLLSKASISILASFCWHRKVKNLQHSCSA